MRIRRILTMKTLQLLVISIVIVNCSAGDDSNCGLDGILTKLRAWKAAPVREEDFPTKDSKGDDIPDVSSNGRLIYQKKLITKETRPLDVFNHWDILFRDELIGMLAECISYAGYKHPKDDSRPELVPDESIQLGILYRHSVLSIKTGKLIFLKTKANDYWIISTRFPKFLAGESDRDFVGMGGAIMTPDYPKFIKAFSEEKLNQLIEMKEK